MLVSAETAVVDASRGRSPPPSSPCRADDDPRRPQAPRRGGARNRAGGWCATSRRPRSAASPALPEGAVLVCEALRPADAALLNPARLAGVAADEGGADGHTAVMLRALGLPAVLGVAGLTQSAAARRRRRGGRQRRQRRAASRAPRRSRRPAARSPPLPASGSGWPGCAGCRAVPPDGEAVELQANLETPGRTAADRPVRRRRHRPVAQRIPVHEPRDAARRAGAGSKPIAPSSRRWAATRSPSGCWTGAARRTSRRCRAPGHRAGGRRRATRRSGMRGIRLLLRRPELFETQLAAILRAAVAGPTRVLLPMVTTVRRGAGRARDL